MKLCKPMLPIIISSLLLTGCMQIDDLMPSAAAGKAEVKEAKAVSTDAVSEDKAEQSKAEAAGEKAAEEEKTVTVIPLICESGYADKQDEDGYSLCYGSYKTLNVGDSSRVALNAALNRIDSDIEEKVTSQIEEFAEAAKEERGGEWGDDILPFYSNCYLDVVRSDDRVVSVLETFFSFAGGAHPDTYYDGFNLRPDTGEKLTLEDVFTDTSKLPEIIEKEVLKTVSEDSLLTKSVKDTVKDMMDDPENNAGMTFLVDNSGVVFVFSPYALTSYAEGSERIRLGFDEYGELIKPEFKSVPEKYIECMIEGLTYRTGRNGTGAEISIEGSRDVNDDIDSISVKLDGKGEMREVYCFNYDPYIVHIGDKTELMLDEYSSNDYRITEVYDLSAEEAKYMDSVDAGVDREFAPVDPDMISMFLRCNLLSTYSVDRKYCIDDSGMLTPKEEFGYVSESSDLKLKLKKPVKARYLDDPEGRSFHEVTLGGGIELGFYRTDLKEIVDMKLADGAVVRFIVDDSDYPQMIGDESIDDIFAETFFAG